MSAAAMNALRCGSAAMPFLILMPFDRPLVSLFSVPAPEWGMLAGSLLVGPLVGATLYIIALKEIGVSRAMPLSGTYPLSTLILDHLLFGQPVTPSLAVGAALVVGGTVLLASPSHRGAGQRPVGRVRLGVALALAASILWGLSTVLLRPAITHLSIVQANAIRMPLVAIILYAFYVLPKGERPWRAPRRALLARPPPGGSWITGIPRKSRVSPFTSRSMAPNCWSRGPSWSMISAVCSSACSCSAPYSRTVYTTRRSPDRSCARAASDRCSLGGSSVAATGGSSEFGGCSSIRRPSISRAEAQQFIL